MQKKTRMNLAAASIHSGANFSEIRSVADAVLRELGIAAEIVPSQDGVLLPGRGADLMAAGSRVGCFGELHPMVLEELRAGAAGGGQRDAVGRALGRALSKFPSFIF